MHWTKCDFVFRVSERIRLSLNGSIEIYKGKENLKSDYNYTIFTIIRRWTLKNRLAL